MSTQIPSLPKLSDVQRYMRRRGWNECPPGIAGSLWIKGDSQIGVPHESDQADIIFSVIERLSYAEELATRKILDQIRYFRCDVTKLRAANDFQIVDSIPFDAVAVIASCSRTMFRSCGTTAIHGRPEIGSGYSQVGDKVIRELRMGHTENGSFVIPVLMELPETKEPDILQGSLDIDGRSAPEPFERRVMRTFAQSIDAVQKLIVEPARLPTSSTLIDIVHLGVSRQFCAALSRILSVEAVSQFETQFRWAEAVAHSPAMPKKVSIEAEAHKLIEETARKLRVTKLEPRQIFSGKIVELRYTTGEPYGHIKVSTIRNNRPSEISVRLTAREYNHAVSWHKDSRPVLVEGQIESGAGQRLVVREPKRCQPVDETYLH